MQREGGVTYSWLQAGWQTGRQAAVNNGQSANAGSRTSTKQSNRVSQGPARRSTHHVAAVALGAVVEISGVSAAAESRVGVVAAVAGLADLQG